MRVYRRYPQAYVIGRFWIAARSLFRFYESFTDHRGPGCRDRRRKRVDWSPRWAIAVDFYKVGLELYASAGMDFVRELKRKGIACSWT